MALFRHNRLKSAIYAGGLAILAHIFHRFIPTSHYAFSLTSTSVAILALSSLAILTVAHHTRQGQVMTQTQEEMLLIGAFGLFWLTFLVIVRAIRSGNMHTGDVTSGEVASGGVSRSTSTVTTGRPKRPEWCSGDSAFCVVEEWKYTRY